LTRYGNFDTSPIAGQRIIPINYGQGPGILNIGMEIRREFTFGPVLSASTEETHSSAAPPNRKPYVDRRYNLRLAIEADNIVNRVNLASPVARSVRRCSDGRPASWATRAREETRIE
jgi:hypothetical protein